MQRIVTAFLLLTAACSGARREAPVVAVAEGDSLTLASKAITSGAWLGERRWAVLSPDDATVWLLDFSARTTSVLGRPARDYRNPFALFAAADTLYVDDWGLARVTVWNREGRLLDSLRGPPALRGNLPFARGPSGAFYVSVRPHPGPDGSGNRDSAVVIRTGPRLEPRDTVARLAPFDLAEVEGDAGRRLERRVFSGEDAWGVAPDGAFWVARVSHNRVEWFPPDGDRIKGPMLPDPVYPVSRLDREAFLQKFPPALRRTADRLPFAEIKPPFVGGVTGADGSIWLRKSRELTDSVQRYHQIDRSGDLALLVEVPFVGEVLAVSLDRLLVAEGLEASIRLWEIARPVAPGASASP